jgi:hypothetical protein
VLVSGRHGRLTRRHGRDGGRDGHTMARNKAQPVRAVPRRPRDCQCSSGSTSFMLAALRVLHVDSSHAPAGIARIEERPFLDPGRLTPVSSTPTPKRPDQEDEEMAARGATCVSAMGGNGIHTPEATHEISGPAEALLPNSPSCGNQPANIKPDRARRVTSRTPTRHNLIRSQKRRPESHPGAASPCPLDKTPLHISRELGTPIEPGSHEDRGAGIERAPRRHRATL